MKHIYVVAGILVDEEHNVFCAQRMSSETLGDQWEFPGGKIEEHESPETALIREFKEELDIHIHVKKHFMTVEHVYDTFKITLDAYKVEYVAGDIHCKIHQSCQWVSMEKLSRLNWTEADLPILKKLLEEKSEF